MDIDEKVYNWQSTFSLFVDLCEEKGYSFLLQEWQPENAEIGRRLVLSSYTLIVQWAWDTAIVCSVNFHWISDSSSVSKNCLFVLRLNILKLIILSFYSIVFWLLLC